MQRGDEPLGQLLISLHHNQAIDRIMNHLPPRSDSGTRGITNLLVAFEKITTPVSGTETPQDAWYNEATCVEFHHLLVATLFGYGQALGDFHDAKGTGTGEASTPEELEQCALKLWDLTHLLWRIAFSGIVQYHFWVLDSSGFLYTPVAGGKGSYEAAVPFAKKKTREGSLKVTNIANTDTEEDSEFQRLTTHDPRQSQQGKRDLYGTPAALAFRRWMRLHVSHFTALNILSTFSFGPGVQRIEDFKISLLSVKHPGPPIQILKEEWEDVIRNLVPPPAHAEALRPFDAQAVINMINNLINTPEDGKDLSTIMTTFRQKSLISSGTVHCEAALASFVKYALPTAEFIGVIKVRSHLHQLILVDTRYLLYRVWILARLQCQNSAVLFVGNFWTS
jgi:hypothetical protein